MSGAESIGRFFLSEGSDGLPIKLNRNRKETVCLGVEDGTSRLVEVHVIARATGTDSLTRESVEQRMHLAMDLQGIWFARFLEAGEEDGYCYYVAELADGEPILSYAMRCGGLDSATVLSLMCQLVTALEQTADFPRLYENLKLEWTMVVPMGEAFVVPMLMDYGFSEPERNEDAESVTRRRLLELANILFLLAKGAPFDGEEDSLLDLMQVPAPVRIMLRHIFAETRQAPSTLEEFLHVLTSSWRGVPGKKVDATPMQLLSLEPFRAPKRAFALAAYPDGSLPEELLGPEYQWDSPSQTGDALYRRTGFDSLKARHLTLHRVPPDRIWQKQAFPAPHVVMSLFQTRGLHHIVKPCGVWETEEATFVAEETGSFLSLERLLAIRHHLQPAEAWLLMNGVRKALEESSDANLFPVALVPSQILLCFPEDKSGLWTTEATVRHVDSWPPHLVKLRLHGVVSSLLGFPGQHRFREAEPGVMRLRRQFANLLLLLLTGPEMQPELVRHAPLRAWVEELCFLLETPLGLPDEEEMSSTLQRLLPWQEESGHGIIADERQAALTGPSGEVIALPPLDAE